MDVNSYPEALDTGLEKALTGLQRLSRRYDVEKVVFGVEGAREWPIEASELSQEEFEEEIVSALSSTNIPASESLMDRSYFDIHIMDTRSYSFGDLERGDAVEAAMLRYDLSGGLRDVETRGGPKYTTGDSPTLEERVEKAFPL